MDDIVFLKKSDLEDVISKAIARILPEPKPEPKQTLTIDEAVEYCADQGYRISKSTIYKHTMDGTIPFRRFGQKKIVFDRGELDQWLEGRLSGKNNDVTKTVAEAARRKERV